MNENMVTKLHAEYSDSICKSNYDSRITIKSSMPVSVTQSYFAGDEIGDSFAAADPFLHFLLEERKKFGDLSVKVLLESHFNVTAENG
ncbi:hypothetical protein LOAG_11940 [Loa loa]|uniref:Uncharacterized protein n=1 Tax=Loa loa TaxID=7209 RepID=A0A1S0TM40_LOALO|nr:hypothetical protein LOAG_11940 [Loa loa]EFO16566.1 hypothetical protein LOAG_11940 [Loa loa]